MKLRQISLTIGGDPDELSWLSKILAPDYVLNADECIRLGLLIKSNAIAMVALVDKGPFNPSGN